VIKNKDSARSKDTARKESEIEKKYLRSRIEDEEERRKRVEKERDVLIKSLDDMTEKGKYIESIMRGLEKENSEIYQRLKERDEEEKMYKERLEEKDKEIFSLKELSKQIDELKQIIENQKLLIGQQSMEITCLKSTNQAYDISNKENLKNMNIVMEKMNKMSSERQKVKHELDHIIQRRKSVKHLSCSNSFHQLPISNRAYPFQQNSLNNLVNQSYCVPNTEKKQDIRSIERSHSDIHLSHLY
jgi:chromosome segregation protein